MTGRQEAARQADIILYSQGCPVCVRGGVAVTPEPDQPEPAPGSRDRADQWQAGSNVVSGQPSCCPAGRQSPVLSSIPAAC